MKLLNSIQKNLNCKNNKSYVIYQTEKWIIKKNGRGLYKLNYTVFSYTSKDPINRVAQGMLGARF